MRALIYSRILKKNDIPYLQELVQTLKEKQVDFVFPRQYWQQIESLKAIEGFHPILEEGEDLAQKQIDVVITLGGDGTILGCLKLVVDTEIPILGINTLLS